MYATSLREHFFAIAIFLRVLRTGARQFSFVFYILGGSRGTLGTLLEGTGTETPFFEEFR